LTYLSPDLIKELKRAALDEDRPAYELAEEAIRDFLKKAKRSK
jgi:predicted transcriptional regulator